MPEAKAKEAQKLHDVKKPTKITKIKINVKPTGDKTIRSQRTERKPTYRLPLPITPLTGHKPYYADTNASDQSDNSDDSVPEPSPHRRHRFGRPRDFRRRIYGEPDPSLWAREEAKLIKNPEANTERRMGRMQLRMEMEEEDDRPWEGKNRYIDMDSPPAFKLPTVPEAEEGDGKKRKIEGDSDKGESRAAKKKKTCEWSVFD